MNFTEQTRSVAVGFPPFEVTVRGDMRPFGVVVADVVVPFGVVMGVVRVPPLIGHV